MGSAVGSERPVVAGGADDEGSPGGRGSAGAGLAPAAVGVRSGCGGSAERRSLGRRCRSRHACVVGLVLQRGSDGPGHGRAPRRGDLPVAWLGLVPSRGCETRRCPVAASCATRWSARAGRRIGGGGGAACGCARRLVRRDQPYAERASSTSHRQVSPALETPSRIHGQKWSP